ncbi:hypothetical protein TRFO_24900 [Tritrichomonas foetus]|uniref:Uncharacterized protein n=1 Tax=Tritrichomonas foetus TaxID=1144522 RepID=A0A1J4K6X8_9EUKA|nr:hypothetical protein TRFO_24900 [Tritrichomonas foetus]|eukprot:OHT06939.1 hypothetical protein TRFO_24900 [Tritrichomonas foetus]
MWDTVHTDPQIPFFAAFVTQIFTCIGILLFEEGKSIWFKVFLGFFSAFVFNFVTSQFWTKFSFVHVSGAKDQLTSRSIRKFFIPQKSRSLLRLLLGSLFTFLPIVFFLYARGTSSVANSMLFILLRLLIHISAGNVRSTKSGRIISGIFISTAILIISISSHVRLIYFLLSFICSWLSFSYVRLLIPAFHNESSVIPPLLLFSSVMALFCSFFTEGFTFNLPIIKTILGGCFIWMTPNFFILIKKNISGNFVISSFTFFPLFFAVFWHFAFLEDNQPPLSLYISTIIAFIGIHALSFYIPEFTNIFKPFSTARSSIQTILSLFIVFVSLFNYFVSQKSNQLWRFADSLYFIVNLIWSLSELFYIMQRTASEQFTFGYGRISSIFSFSISVFAFFSVILLLSKILIRDEIKIVKFASNFPSIFLHFVLLVFFIVVPRIPQNKRSKSIRNAVNLNSASHNPQSEIHSNQKFSFLSFVDAFVLILVIIASFYGSSNPSIHSSSLSNSNINSTFSSNPASNSNSNTITDSIMKSSFADSLISVIYLIVIIYLVVPVIYETILRLMQTTPEHIQSCYSSIRSQIRQCSCVTEISYMNFWQNDEALTAATIKVRIDEKQCPKPQEFLMFIISICQQAGVLDVTVEIIDRNEEIFLMATHNPFRRNSTIV